MNDEIPIETAFRKLGMKANVSTFEDRIKLQKIVYLCEELFGLKLGFASSFSWYLHGPYSPTLTRVVFRKKEGKPIGYSQFDELKAVVARDFFKRYSHPADKLELIGSLYYIIKNIKEANKTSKETFRKLKPQFKPEEVDEAFDIITNAECNLNPNVNNRQSAQK